MIIITKALLNRNFHTTTRLVLTLLMIMSPLITVAEESKISEINKDDVESLNESGINIVVIASRGSEQNPLDIPQSTASISRFEIEEHHYTSITDAIRSIPGVGLSPAEGTPS